MNTPVVITPVGFGQDPRVEVRAPSLPLTFEVAAGGVWVSKHSATVQFLTPCCQAQWHYILSSNACSKCLKSFPFANVGKRSLEYKWVEATDEWLPTHVEALPAFLELTTNTLEGIAWRLDFERVILSMVTWLRHRHYVGMEREYELTLQELVDLQAKEKRWTTWA